MQRLLDKNQITQEEFENKRKKLDNWLSEEKEKLLNNRSEIEKGWITYQKTLK